MLPNIRKRTDTPVAPRPYGVFRLNGKRSATRPIGMYDSYMKELPVSEARNRLADVIEEAQRSGEPISVTRRGRPVAVILDPDTFDRLVDIAEDVDDRRELAEVLAEDDFVPWDEAKAALGLE